MNTDADALSGEVKRTEGQPPNRDRIVFFAGTMIGFAIRVHPCPSVVYHLTYPA